MTTYITSLDTFDLTATEREMEQFERDARAVPASRRDEALRCWLIGKRTGAQEHININWQQLGGKSDAQIVALLNDRIGQHRRSAGGKAAQKALEKKYGIETADRIIANKKAGR